MLTAGGMSGITLTFLTLLSFFYNEGQDRKESENKCAGSLTLSILSLSPLCIVPLTPSNFTTQDMKLHNTM